jgi:hypothetical protein
MSPMLTTRLSSSRGMSRCSAVIASTSTMIIPTPEARSPPAGAPDPVRDHAAGGSPSLEARHSVADGQQNEGASCGRRRA